MSEQAQAPAEQAPETTTEVKDPNAVLAKNAELLEEVKKYKALAKNAEGFDFEKAKAAIAAQEQAEQDRLAAEGQWKELQQQLEERHKRDLSTAKKDYDRLTGHLFSEALKTEAVRHGVLGDRLRAAIAEGDLNNVLSLDIDESGYRLKKQGGIGDDREIAEIFDGLKKSAPYLFAGQTQTGGGASGSGSNGGASAKTATRSQWDSWTPEERSAFAASGGKLTN